MESGSDKRKGRRTVEPFDVFQLEQSVLINGESLLSDDADGVDYRGGFKELLDSYRKLLQTSKRLVRVSDRTEEKLREAHRRISRQQQKLEEELRFARDIQMSMVPGQGRMEVDSALLSLFACLVPARAIGGDLYDVWRKDDTVHFLVGDVSDKGVPAALLMAKTITLYANARNEGLRPAEILSRMNRALCIGNEKCMFVTAVCGSMDLITGSTVLANAGHMPPLVFGHGECAKLSGEGGPALGLLEDIDYPELRFELASSRMLLLYSDGISEAENMQRLQYSTSRLTDFCRDAGKVIPTLFGPELLADLAAFVGEAEQSDDITLMVLGRG